MNANEPSYVLWIFSAILEPLQGGFIALVYTLDRETLKRLNCKLVAAARKRERQFTSTLAKDEGRKTHYKKVTDINCQKV